ncbi:hypothetical protein Taro_001271 [Colocasia esculenta]|uniref:Uncharacterized protein n=1 Tax=Colocasia esculenta TaxID=4460 RepID=A0A843TAG8_COLES|nr:hypothetical protein [Colocasia esculenta]
MDQDRNKGKIMSRKRVRGSSQEGDKEQVEAVGSSRKAWFLEHSGSKSPNYVNSLPRICRWYKSSLLRKDNVKRKMLGNLGQPLHVEGEKSHRQHRKDYAGRHKILDEDAKLIEDFLHNDIVDKFRWLAGTRGKAVVRVVAADRAGNGELERGVRGTFLGFHRDSRFFGDCPYNRPRAILYVLAGSAVKILASTSVDAEFFVGRLTARYLAVDCG